jgi:serine/threonine-protein kinase
VADSRGLVQLPTRARIGRFQIQKLLGRGGMGEVYKAFDPSLDRIVALKTIVAGGDDASLRERLLREARACGRLQHPGIVTVYDIGEADGVVFIAMEFLEGQNLADALRAGALGAEQTFNVLIQMLDALDYAHGEGVVHRDIKPGNVLLLPNGRIKLLDFGIARIAKADPLTMTGEVVGTPNYMSPEQMKAHALDGRTDIYSTGIVGYELLTGRPAFAGETITAVMLKVLGEPAPPMATAVSLACPEVEAIIQRAIAKSTDARYQRARDMAEALREMLNNHRDVILQASLGGQLTARTPAQGMARAKTTTATTAADDATLRLYDSDAPTISPEPTPRVTTTPPPPAPVPSASPLGPTTRLATTERFAPEGATARRSGTRLTWPLIGAALVVIGLIVYLAPRLQPTNEVQAGSSPAPSTSAPTPAPATPAQTQAPTPAVPAPPVASAPAATPNPGPPVVTTPAPPAASSPQISTAARPPAVSTPATSAPTKASGPLDAHAVSFASGSDEAVTAALIDALKDQGILRSPTNGRWLLTVHSQIATRPTGLGSSSALTADYTGDLTIQDRQTGASDARHFDGHAMEFGEPVARAAAARALAKQMADALATLLK